MVDFGNIKNIYFIGIGGIGMSALARYFASRKMRVSGYDRTQTNLTKQLVAEGIEVVFEDDAALAPRDVQLVVYTPAVPADHKQLNFYRDNGYDVLKRSEVLGAITENSFNICVAGTHGKTTISTMVAHILRHTGYGCNAFLGGIAANYNSNFWSSERNVCVVEADEYDRSFLRLSPDIAVVTAMDPDHLEIYGTREAMQEAFVQFAGKIKDGGSLYFKHGLEAEVRFDAPRKLSFSLENKAADIHVIDLKLINGNYLFDMEVGDKLISDIALNMGGVHNVENVCVAIAIADLLGIDSQMVKNAVEEFRGVKRRFEYIIKKKNRVYIDDYAHHPAELETLIKSAKNLFPGKKCTIIFQPHLFTRTRDLAGDFAKSLDMADEVILLPIYPARELPIEGVSSGIILQQMTNGRVTLASKEETLQIIRDTASQAKNEVLITAGAGDIDTMVDQIRQILTATNE